MNPSLPYPPSYYSATAVPHPIRSALEGDHAADVCVVGAGLTGLGAALSLAERGYSVVVVEQIRVAYAASGRNGGQLWSGHRLGVVELEEALGRPLARALWDLAEESKKLLAERVARHRIRCDLAGGTLLAASRRAHVAGLEREAEHLARWYGYEQARVLTRAEMRDAVATRRYHAGLLDPDGGHLHPLNLALGLASAAVDAGVRLFEDSPVESIDWNLRSTVHTARGQVRARFVLLCANLGNSALVPGLASEVFPLASAQVATAPLGDEVGDPIPAGCCVCSTGPSIEYFRTGRDRRLLFGAGERWGHRGIDRPERLARPRLARVFPQLAHAPIDHAWAGHVVITRDRMPRFGRIAPNGFYVHGFSGQGVVLSQIAGRLLAEAVAGTAERFDVLAGLPRRDFPRLGRLTGALAAATVAAQALRDRL